MLEKTVPVVVAIWTVGVQTPVQRKSWYAVTAVLSVDAVQARFTDV